MTYKCHKCHRAIISNIVDAIQPDGILLCEPCAAARKPKKLPEIKLADRPIIKAHMMCLAPDESGQECQTHFTGLVKTGGSKMPPCPTCHRTSGVFVTEWIERR
jgi:DNA-directed RNA polymerase subunit RPC12/RpoP